MKVVEDADEQHRTRFARAATGSKRRHVDTVGNDHHLLGQFRIALRQFGAPAFRLEKNDAAEGKGEALDEHPVDRCGVATGAKAENVVVEGNDTRTTTKPCDEYRYVG